MKKLGFILFFLSTLVFAASDFSLSKEAHQIEVNNRIILKINDKAISVMDLARRMDVLFYRQFPELAEIPLAKYQFYAANFRTVLEALIDDELILADAQEKKIEVTDGDVREELETLFGPDVVLNLHKAGLTFEEAWKLLKEELVVRRMSQMMVRSKAMLEVHPSKAKQLYQKIAKEDKREGTWNYRVLTIESENKEEGEKLAQDVYQKLTVEKIPINDILARLKEANVEARLSEEFSREESALSVSHRAILAQMAAGAYSMPQAQPSKKEGMTAWRIFCLKERQEKPTLTFGEVEEKIIANLTQEANQRNRKSYTQKLREHFGISQNYLSQMIPEDFQPFAFK